MIFIIFILFYSTSTCLPESAPIYYCETKENISLKWYECKNNKIATEVVKTCPKFYEEKIAYYTGDKKVSFIEFNKFIKEKNESCNGCIQRIWVPVK